MARLFARLRNALRAFNAPLEEGVPWVDEVAPIPPKAIEKLANAPVPAAFRPLPTYHSSLLHFYEAEDFSNDPKSPYKVLLAQAQGVADTILYEHTVLVLPEHTRLHYEYVVANSNDGCYAWRNKRIPYEKYSHTYEVAWIGREAVLIAYNPCINNLGTQNSVQHKRRTYVTRLSLPHPWYKLIHTLHLPPTLASKIDVGVAPEGVE